MDYLNQIKRLRDQGQPFVLATVVRIEKPTSSKPGAKAIITQDGTLYGWIGGSCAEPNVKREAAKALQDGNPRLLRLCPPEKMGSGPQEGITEIGLTCASGGTLEIYIEPYLTQPHLIIIGHQAIAEELVKMGKALDYQVTVTGDEILEERFVAADQVISGLDFSKLEINSNSYVIIASHGNYDEIALEAVLPSEAPYVALVVSKKRAAAVREYLQQAGLTSEQITRFKFPAGLDIGAITPQEIALSILAEIIQHRRQGTPVIKIEPETTAEEIVTAIDPVCSMTVEVENARYTATHDGKAYYFCSAHCQHLFKKEPEKYLQTEVENES
jgi:xanthine dehydrogenase accessory factor